MSTIILGYSGFIGKYIYKILKNKKEFTIGGNSKNCNLLKKKNIKHFFKNKDNFNLIICSSLVRSKVDTKKSQDNNILMISNLIEQIKKKKIKKIIFLSSIDVYSQNGKLIENRTKTNPKTKYGNYKLLAEKLLKINFPKKKLVILRLTGVYDHNINGKNMISYIRRGLKKNFLYIKSSGEELRDYIHAHDVSIVVHYFIKKKNFGVFNLASGVSKKVKYYVNKLNNVNSEKKKILYDNKVQLKDIIVDVKKLNKLLPISKFRKI